MSRATIQGVERTIGKIFNEDYVFSIPSYQRPYAWTTEQAGELLDDIAAFVSDDTTGIEDLTPYFLGSIVLIKGDAPDAKIVDGQQRLTTLTILLATLRMFLPDVEKEGLTSYLYQKGSIFALTPDRYRLTIRERDTKFFQKYIQKGDIEQLIQLDPEILTDSQKNIRANAQLFFERLRQRSDETKDQVQHRLVRLAQFIINRCFLVVVSTPDDDSAYRIFSVLNDRGLDLSLTDILKAEVIGKVPAQQQDDYNRKWEDIETYLGRESFQNLFAYIRTIYRKVKPQDSILKEFRAYVRPTEHPGQFIDNVLAPYADAYQTIKHATYLSTTNAFPLNSLFGWLNRIDNADWFPPAIAYFSKNQHQSDLLLRYFTDLERLAAGLMILRANINKRIERYNRLLAAIERGDDLFTPTSLLQLTDDERKDILIALDGNMYENWSCRYVLLRLDEALADRGAKYDYTIISIEHVLPQNPKAESTWMTWFPDEDKRKQYVHQIGNLVLLSTRKNSEARNFDFDKKKQKYFTALSGVSPFALTTQVLRHTEWTPAVVEQRQHELIQTLKKLWRL